MNVKKSHGECGIKKRRYEIMKKSNHRHMKTKLGHNYIFTDHRIHKFMDNYINLIQTISKVTLT